MSSYNFYNMTPKLGIFGNVPVTSTSSDDYIDWKDTFEEDRLASRWIMICGRYAEQAQFSILRGMTVVGSAQHDWGTVFSEIINGYGHYQSVVKAYLNGNQVDWRFFATTFARDADRDIYYPALYPEWLFPYGYTQQQYVQDLKQYWENVHDDYYVLWETTRLGQDSPEVARLKKIGQEARREIDEVARHSAQQRKQ